MAASFFGGLSSRFNLVDIGGVANNVWGGLGEAIAKNPDAVFSATINGVKYDSYAPVAKLVSDAINKFSPETRKYTVPTRANIAKRTAIMKTYTADIKVCNDSCTACKNAANTKMKAAIAAID